jgi:hypothetical protein
MLRVYYKVGVITISLRLPKLLGSQLAEEARRRRTSKSAVIRECVEAMLHGSPAKPSCLDLAGDLAGCLEGTPDLATNPKYMDGYGQ